MSKYLFLLDLKTNRVMIIAFTLILAMYASIATGMYDPESAESMNAMLDMLPEGMAKAFSFTNFGTELTSYISSYLYGFIFFMFPMIFIILVGNNIMVKHIDSGSMAYILTTPHTRRSVATTQAVFLMTSTIFIVIMNMILIILMSGILFPGKLDVGNFIMLNITTLSVLLFISSIVFFCSSYFDDRSRSLAYGSFVSIFFFVINAIKNISDQLSFLRFFTPFALVNIDKILEGGAYSYVVSLITLLVTATIYTFSIYNFNKRSLAL